MDQRAGTSMDLPVTVESSPAAIRHASADVHFRIEPSRPWQSLGLGEVWRYREMLYFFAWRDIKVRYKQSLLGVGWALLQPLGTMAILTFVFSTVIRITPPNDAPYAVFVLSGLVPWFFFSNSLTRATEAVVN